jgi:MFS family permease
MTTLIQEPHPHRLLLRLSIGMFVAYLSIGLPLGIIPLYVHQQLGLNDVMVGIAIGTQFLTTLITRSTAGRWADHQGARRTAFLGMASCVGSGIATLAAALMPGNALALAYGLLIGGRVLLGLGESLLLTGNLTWGMGLAGSSLAGKVMSWNGMATYGAMAAGAPLGLAIYHSQGMAAASGLMLVLPLIALVIDKGVPPVAVHTGKRQLLSAIWLLIWRPGLGLMLQGIGFSVLSVFVTLYFAQFGWPYAGFALTAFGSAFIAVRLTFGNLPDKMGGIKVAQFSLLVECAGLLLIFLAVNPLMALAGAALTGCGCSLIFPSLGVEVVRRVPPEARGTALGGFSAFQDLAYALTGPLAGILTGHAGYRSVFLLAAVCAFLGMLLVKLGLTKRG